MGVNGVFSHHCTAVKIAHSWHISAYNLASGAPKRLIFLQITKITAFAVNRPLPGPKCTRQHGSQVVVPRSAAANLTASPGDLSYKKDTLSPAGSLGTMGLPLKYRTYLPVLPNPLSQRILVHNAY